jgi:hypothetical protein
VFRIRIRIVFGCWILIRIEVKIQELSRLKMEPLRVKDAQNREDRLKIEAIGSK